MTPGPESGKLQQPPSRPAVASRGGGRCQRSADLAAYLPLVRRIVGQLRRRLPANADVDELTQAGLIGLNEAMSRFEQGEGSTFETYAARRIEGAMLDALRANDLMPRELRARLRQLRTAVQRLEHQLGRAPRAREVANALAWPLAEVHACMVDAGAGGMRAGDEWLERAEDPPYGAMTAADGSDPVAGEQSDPLRALQLHQRHAVLSAAFDALEEAERRVMEAIYERDLKLEEVGQELGVSASYVSQVRTRIVDKLRRRLRDA